jgi:hypothetical protein
MAASRHDDLLSMYATYLDERGYRAAKIPETTTKTPDLEVSGYGSDYLNEFKSPDLLLDQVLGLYKFTTTNSKLLQFIHTAIKQFRAYDPSHGKPWVITFASGSFQLNGHTLVEAMQGGIAVEGRVMADWTETSVFERWTADRYDIDLYVWLQVSDVMQPYQASFVTNDRSPHRPLVDGLVTNLGAVPLGNMDNNWLLV